MASRTADPAPGYIAASSSAAANAAAELGAGLALAATPAGWFGATTVAAEDAAAGAERRIREVAPQLVEPFRRATDTAQTYGYAAIALAVALGIAGIGFIVWNLRKAAA